MRRVSWFTEKDNQVILTETVEFSCKMTSVTINNKKSVPPDRMMMSVFIKHVAKPDHSEFVVCPSSITESDCPVRRELLLVVPGRYMYLFSEDNHWRYCSSVRANSLYRCNLFAISSLRESWTAFSLFACDNLLCIYY